jgi:hypothetical protein
MNLQHVTEHEDLCVDEEADRTADSYEDSGYLPDIRHILNSVSLQVPTS